MAFADVIELLVNGKVYSGWKEATITRSMKALCGGFSLSLTDRWLGQSKPWPIVPENACEFRLDGQTFLTGYVDTFDSSIDGKNRTLSVAGRDKTAALVDCSAKPKNYANISLTRFAQELCTPFGIKVVPQVEAANTPFPSLRIGPGEKAFDAIEKAARQKGVLLISSARGELLLVHAGKQKTGTELVEGQNIKAAGARFDHKDRFSEYHVVSQFSGSEEMTAELQIAGISGNAVDPNVLRFRPLIVTSEVQVDSAAAKRRAQWEATTRAGRAQTVSITLKGFRRRDGVPWFMSLNQLTTVRSKSIGVEKELLIIAVKMSKGKNGSIVDLELEEAGAYADLPMPTPQELLRDLVNRESRP